MTMLVHVDLVVRDMARSLAFYVDVFGCSVVEDAVIEGPVPEFYTRGHSRSMRIVLMKVASSAFGMLIELMEFGKGADGSPAPGRFGSESETPSLLNLTFLVDSLEAKLAELAKGGVAPASPIMPVDLPKSGGANMVFIRDPDGNLIELVERRRPS